MRVVVVGPYPTMPGPEAADDLALVRRLVAEGHDVVTASPEPSAAHVHLDPGGARGAARLARLVGGADRLVLRLDATALRADVDPRPALAGRVALAAALRRVADVELRLDRVPERVTAQFAGLVLAPAATIVVATDEEKAALQRSGVATAKVSVAPAARAAVAPATHGRGDGARPETASLPDDASAAEITSLVRELAARRRSSERDSQRPSEGSASRVLRLIPPLEAAPARSSKPGVAYFKRVQRRVIGWQFDWTIQHVNRLHRATVDAIDDLEREVRGQADDRTRS